MIVYIYIDDEYSLLELNEYEPFFQLKTTINVCCKNFNNNITFNRHKPHRLVFITKISKTITKAIQGLYKRFP